MGTIFQETVAMDLTSCESWINFLSEESKIFKTSIFSKLCFPKCDNFKISNTDNICLSLSRTKWVRFNNERTKFSELWGYTSKLKIIKIFFMKQYFFLNSNHDHPPQSAVNFIIYQNCSQKDIKLLSRKDVIALFTFNLCFIRISSVIYPQSYC